MFAGVFANDYQFSTDQFQWQFFGIESFDVQEELITVFVISSYQRVWDSHVIVSPRWPLNSGKVQIMVVEEVNFKRVIFERVPVHKVKEVLSMPQSVLNKIKVT